LLTFENKNCGIILMSSNPDNSYWTKQFKALEYASSKEYNAGLVAVEMGYYKPNEEQVELNNLGVSVRMKCTLIAQEILSNLLSRQIGEYITEYAIILEVLDMFSINVQKFERLMEITRNGWPDVNDIIQFFFSSKWTLSWADDFYIKLMRYKLSKYLRRGAKLLEEVVCDFDMLVIPACGDPYIHPLMTAGTDPQLFYCHEGYLWDKVEQTRVAARYIKQGFLDMICAGAAIYNQLPGLGACHGAQIAWLTCGGSMLRLIDDSSSCVRSASPFIPLNKTLDKQGKMTVTTEVMKNYDPKMKDLSTQQIMKCKQLNLKNFIAIEGEFFKIYGVDNDPSTNRAWRKTKDAMVSRAPHVHSSTDFGFIKYDKPEPPSDPKGIIARSGLSNVKIDEASPLATLNVRKQYDQAWAMIIPPNYNQWLSAYSSKNKDLKYWQVHPITELLSTLTPKEIDDIRSDKGNYTEGYMSFMYNKNKSIKDKLDFGHDKARQFLRNAVGASIVDGFRINNYVATQYHPEHNLYDMQNYEYFKELIELVIASNSW
jgi:hypothetical protein